MKCADACREFFGGCTRFHWVGSTPTGKRRPYTGSNQGEQALQQVFHTIHHLIYIYNIYIYSPVHECRIQIISVSEEEIENFSAQGLCDLRWGFATQQWLEPSLEDGNFQEWESKPTWGDIFHCLLGSCNFPKGSHFRCSWMGWTSWVCAQGEVERAKIPILNVQSMVQDTFLLACRDPNWQVHETQAGAVADCFKHLVLVALLQSLQVWHWSRARSQRWWESVPMIWPDQYKRI